MNTNLIENKPEYFPEMNVTEPQDLRYQQGTCYCLCAFC